MARLLIKTEGFDEGVLQLHLGTTRLGRSGDNDFQIDHPTVSANHCEIRLSDRELTVQDCGSTNGTFVDDRRVQKAKLRAGQVLRLGDVELLVENTEVVVAIPQFDMPRPTPPIVRADGAVLCPRHEEVAATYGCAHCNEVMCDQCVHRLRRRGGKVLKLCPICSHPVQLLGPEKKRKRNLLGFLRKTIKLPFVGTRKERE